jgi:hypothetical protein
LTPPPGGLQQLTGLTMDTGFAPDHLFYINCASGNIYADQVALASGGATKTYRGTGIVGSGVGALTGGINPNALLVAMDNTNTGGVTASSVTGAATATTGLEVRMPFADIALPLDPAARAGRVVRIAAALVRTDGTLGNQWLPGCPSATGSLGMAPNMNTIAGQQFALLTLPTPGPTCDSIDFNQDGLFPDTGDIDDFLSVFSGGPCSTAPVPGCNDIDFNNDGLYPDTTDIDAMLSVFSGGACA